MAHKIKLNADLGVVVVQYTGVVSSDEITAVMDESVHLPGFHKGLKAIGDFRDCDVLVASADVNKLVSYAKRHDLAWGDTRWALIADKDYIYGLARMFSAKTNEMHVETSVFRSAAEADDWLSIGVSLDDAVRQTFA